MAYEFTVGKFLNGIGIEESLTLIQKPVAAAALFQVANLQRAFREQGHASRGGPRWADWSPDYAKDRARKGRTNVLIDSGILRQSMTSQVIVEGTRTIALIGSNVWYGKVHQDGVRKIVYRKAHHRTMRRQRGKWTVEGRELDALGGGRFKKRKGVWVKVDGIPRFKKGRALKPKIVELPDGTTRSVLPRQQIGSQAFRLDIPARPIAVVTAQDGIGFQKRVETWTNEAINGRGKAQGGSLGA